MIEQESGSIVNITSVAGLLAFANSTSYNISKGGVLQLTRSLANEWGEYGIRIYAICPGVFETEMTEDMLDDEDFVEDLKQKVPLNRTGTSDELAPAGVYLASEASSYMTGHALVIDGGWTCHL